MDFSPRNIWRIIAIVVAIEIVSLVGWFFQPIETIALVLLGVATFILSLRSLNNGACIILTELAIGSLGYLFSVEVFGFNLSIRIVLFLAVFAAFLISLMRKKVNLTLLQDTSGRYYLVMLLILLGAILLGIYGNERTNVIFDANAWLFFLLLPVFIIAGRQEHFFKTVLEILLATSGYIALKTILLLIAFSHAWVEIGDPIYRWVRDTRVGEITYINGTLFRIFIQSQLFLGFTALIILALACYHWHNLNKKNKYILLGIAYLSTFALVISQSRSFWVGFAASLVGLYVIVWLGKKITFLTLVKISVACLAVAISQFFLLQLLTGSFGQNTLANRFGNLSNDAASSSRANQLPVLLPAIINQPIFGYGFGKTLTYQSNDPRVLEAHPDGQYTTYAFEWGYLDITLKLGLLGLLIYIAFVVISVKNVFSQTLKNPLALGLATGLLFIAIVNIFSPYLNHPLGIGLLLILIAFSQQLAQSRPDNSRIAT